MPGKRIGAVAASALLALASLGCAREADPDLALACQIRNCVCRPEKPPLFSVARTAEVLWRENGDAYCPAGYVLRLADE